MANPTSSKGMRYGAYYIFIAKRDSSGRPVGQVADPETISNATTMQPYLIQSIVSFTPETRPMAIFTNRGGQRVISKRVAGVDDLGEATFTLSQRDEAFLALIKGTTVDTTTVSGLVETAGNVNQRNFPQLFVMIGTKVTDDVTGADYWQTDIYHNAQIYQPQAEGISQDAGTNPNPLTFNLIPSASTKHISGRSFSSSSGLYVTGDSDAVTSIKSNYPLAFTSFKAAAASNTYALGYRPIYTTASGATDNSFTKNGTTFAGSSLSATTGAFAFTAGADADFHIALYQTNFVPI